MYGNKPVRLSRNQPFSVKLLAATEREGEEHAFWFQSYKLKSIFNDVFFLHHFGNRVSMESLLLCI